jgi:formylglycine-generating enzyme required for sulfatase activity
VFISAMSTLPSSESLPSISTSPTSLESFCIQRNEVTIAEYRFFDPTRRLLGGDQLPIREVSWYEAYAYAAWRGARLPTALEWELACAEDSRPDRERGWSELNSHGEPQPIGLIGPNRNGLRDMLGNAAEWCLDWAPSSEGISRVYMGGSWIAPAEHLSCRRRAPEDPAARRPFIGVRMVKSPSAGGLCD